jgi:hypothetical protein
MYKVLGFLMNSAVATAASPSGADCLWTADDLSLTMTVPADSDPSLEDLRDDPERILPPFLAMMGVTDGDVEVTDQGLSIVSENVALERVIVGSETCHREVNRRSEVLLDFAGTLTRTDWEEYGQAFSAAGGTPCDLPPEAYSSVSILPGTWKIEGAESE